MYLLTHLNYHEDISMNLLHLYDKNMVIDLTLVITVNLTQIIYHLCHLSTT